MNQPSSDSSNYWNEVVSDAQKGAPLDSWRGYMRFVYGKLIVSWLPERNSYALKTDLFEEAISVQGPLSDLGRMSIGLDRSLSVVRAAHQRFSANGHNPGMFVCDLRNVALQNDSISRILSGSSLDHFEKKAELLKALSELARILKPGGILVLTLDNPLNPIVWLRNHLPFHWLNRLGVVPYFVGTTCNAKEGRKQLEQLGLKVTHVTAVAHVPRAPAIFFTWLGERWKWKALNSFTGRMMESFEILQQWPTRYLTGYYIAFRAVKPEITSVK
jgi:SAM-dependent methyltransferase